MMDLVEAAVECSIKDLESNGKVIGDLVFAPRQIKAQQSANEHMWISECAESLGSAKAFAPTLEDDSWSSRRD